MANFFHRHVECPILLSDVKQIWSFWTGVCKSPQYEISLIYVEWKPCWYMRTDGRTCSWGALVVIMRKLLIRTWTNFSVRLLKHSIDFLKVISESLSKCIEQSLLLAVLTPKKPNWLETIKLIFQCMSHIPFVVVPCYKLWCCWKLNFAHFMWCISCLYGTLFELDKQGIVGFPSPKHPGDTSICGSPNPLFSGNRDALYPKESGQGLKLNLVPRLK